MKRKAREMYDVGPYKYAVLAAMPASVEMPVMEIKAAVMVKLPRAYGRVDRAILELLGEGKIEKVRRGVFRRLPQKSFECAESPKDVDQRTQTDVVLDHIRSQPPQTPLRPATVAYITNIPMDSIYAVFSRLVKDGLLIRTARGEYALTRGRAEPPAPGNIDECPFGLGPCLDAVDGGCRLGLRNRVACHAHHGDKEAE